MELWTCEKLALFRIARPDVVPRVAGVAYRFKAESMQCGGPQFFQGVKMVGRAVAFVVGETVAGEDAIPFGEGGVACHFGEDGCGGNRKAQGIAVDERLLRNGQVDGDGVDQ